VEQWLEMMSFGAALPLQSLYGRMLTAVQSSKSKSFQIPPNVFP